MKQEEIKELWELCGFTILLDGHCLYPEDRGVSGRVKLLPPIDLDNLFKYGFMKVCINYGEDIARELLVEWADEVCLHGHRLEKATEDLAKAILKVLRK